MNTPCTAVNFNTDGRLTVAWPNESVTVDHVISGIPAQTLANILPKDWEGLASELKNIHNTTVGVVNLEYEGSVVPVEGFGYLVPSSEPLPVLGIIFDSCAFPENDRRSGKTTRITVSLSWTQGSGEGRRGGYLRKLLVVVCRPLPKICDFCYLIIIYDLTKNLTPYLRPKKPYNNHSNSKHFFTITAEILVYSLANFYCQ